jgi:hypothetical protein
MLMLCHIHNFHDDCLTLPNIGRDELVTKGMTRFIFIFLQDEQGRCVLKADFPTVVR